MRFANPFSREFWVMDDPEMSVPPGPEAIFQAHCSAVALEQDRAELRADLMRRLRQNKDQRERIEAALDELDALRVLERAS